MYHGSGCRSTRHDAFEKLKSELCKEGNALRTYDSSLETKLYIDWSKVGVGVVLS
jgi:hypothetical protein